jgi:hypothetical protein
MQQQWYRKRILLPPLVQEHLMPPMHQVLKRWIP